MFALIERMKTAIGLRSGVGSASIGDELAEMPSGFHYIYRRDARRDFPSNHGTLDPYPLALPRGPYRELARLEIGHFFSTPEASASVSVEQDLADADDLVTRSAGAIAMLHEQVRLGRAIEIFKLDPLIDALAAFAHRNLHALTCAARAKRHGYAVTHPVAVATLMIGLGMRLDLGPREMREAALAGLLLDIGTLGLPHGLFAKPLPLNEQELGLIRTHVSRGHDILALSLGLPPAVLDACRHHHERMDGSGYPDRLSGIDIGLLARMAAICDTYDAMTSKRPYSRALIPSRALREMQRLDGQFDPLLLQTVVAMLGPHPMGALVRLNSGRLAIVKALHETAMGRPLVIAFQASPRQQPMTIEEIDLAADTSEEPDAIAAGEDPERWRLGWWDEHWRDLLTPCDPPTGLAPSRTKSGIGG